MNKTTLLITLLAGFATAATAAETPAENAVVVLPTYVVNAPRTLPAERQIELRREEFVRQALAPRAVLPEPVRLQLSAERILHVTATAPTAKRHPGKSRS